MSIGPLMCTHAQARDEVVRRHPRSPTHVQLGNRPATGAPGVLSHHATRAQGLWVTWCVLLYTTHMTTTRILPFFFAFLLLLYLSLSKFIPFLITSCTFLISPLSSFLPFTPFNVYLGVLCTGATETPLQGLRGRIYAGRPSGVLCVLMML